MHDLGRHRIPVVTALPAQAEPNQIVRFNDVTYIFHPTFLEWVPQVGLNTSIVEQDYVKPVGFHPIGGFQAKANGIYEVQATYMYSWGGGPGNNMQLLAAGPADARASLFQERGLSKTGGGDSGGQIFLPYNDYAVITGTNIPLNTGPLFLGISGFVQMGPTAGLVELRLIAGGNSPMTILRGSNFNHRRIK